MIFTSESKADKNGGITDLLGIAEWTCVNIEECARVARELEKNDLIMRLEDGVCSASYDE